MLPLSLSPGQQLLQGYFLPCLAWRQPRGPSELRGWQGHRCHLPFNLLCPANAKPGTQHWGHSHGPFHWQNGMAEMFKVCALFLFSYGPIRQMILTLLQLDGVVVHSLSQSKKKSHQEQTTKDQKAQVTLFNKSYPLWPCALFSTLVSGVPILRDASFPFEFCFMFQRSADVSWDRA